MVGSFRFPLFILLANGVSAQSDFQAQMQFNGSVNLNKKLSVQVLNRFWTDRGYRELFQLRTGGFLAWNFLPRVQTITGYHFVWQHAGASVFYSNRPFVGVQFRLVDTRKFTLDSRNLIERHFVSAPPEAPRPDFTRYRTRLQLMYRLSSNWQPYLGAEGLWANDQARPRITAGLTWRSPGGHILGMGYEYRVTLAGVRSHILVTLFQLKPWSPEPRAAKAPRIP